MCGSEKKRKNNHGEITKSKLKSRNHEITNEIIDFRETTDFREITVISKSRTPFKKVADPRFLVSHNSNTYTRVFVWLLVTLLFIAQVNREAFYLNIYITVTVME